MVRLQCTTHNRGERIHKEMAALAKTSNKVLSNSLRNLETFPPPVSETDQKFVESLAKNVSKIKVRRKSLPGSINDSENGHNRKSKIPVNNELRRKILEGKKDLQKHEEKKEKVLMEGEKERWETMSRISIAPFQNCLLSTGARRLLARDRLL